MINLLFYLKINPFKQSCHLGLVVLKYIVQLAEKDIN